MRIIRLTAGAGGRICGSCLHDNALVRALRRRGPDAPLVPASRCFPTVPCGERRDGRLQRAVRRTRPAMPVPVPARLRDEIRKPLPRGTRADLPRRLCFGSKA